MALGLGPLASSRVLISMDHISYAAMPEQAISYQLRSASHAHADPMQLAPSTASLAFKFPMHVWKVRELLQEGLPAQEITK